MRTLITALLSLAIAAPAFPAGRIRAVNAYPLTLVSFSATVSDLATGKPVVEAEVSSEMKSTLTDARGAFTIPLPAGKTSTLTIKRSGYETAQVSVNPSTPSNAPITLRSLQNVVVQSTNGPNVTIDADTFEFFYAQPLMNQLHAKEGAFCDAGTQINADRSEISRLSGPATAGEGGACCARPTLWFDVKLKNGESHHVSSVYSCYGYQAFIGGRDHDTHKMVYVDIMNLKQADLP